MSVVIPVPEREAAAQRAETQLQALQSCLKNLLLNGVRVLAYNAAEHNKRDRITVSVAASPQLYRIYADSCAPFRREQIGAKTIFTWLAIDIENNIRVEWEEVSCGT